MISHYLDWLHLLLRWLHFTAGVAWIGASFYFNWLENHLNRKENLREELAGNLWAVHGGGFYYLEKYKVAPKSIPKTLHWFKWEAYITWISGFMLLSLLYYLNPSTYLIDSNIAQISNTMAVGISLLSLVSSWLIYDLLSNSGLVEKNKLFFVHIFAFFSLAAYGLTQVFSARAAFIHIGAMIGTIMVANVFFVIIPSQKSLVDAASKGESPNAALGKKALMRSRHNNYFTLPVLFIMMSQHFPMTMSGPANWAVLAGISLFGVGIRHYFNVRHLSHRLGWIWPLSLIAILGLGYVTLPKSRVASNSSVRIEQVSEIIKSRCLSCHSSNPTDKVFATSPNEVRFDTLSEIKKWSDRIFARVVEQKTMPLANQTQMTEEEREIIANWVLSGAKIE
jgi:uncharacterized membrane protein